MELQNIKENVLSSILRFSIPSIVAMIVSSSVTIIDGFFIGNYVGKEGLAAINLGLPILFLYLGIGIMLGVGGIAIAGMLFGRNEIEESNNIFNQTIFTTIVASGILSLIMFFLVIQFGNKFDFRLSNYFKEYYLIMLIAYPVMILNTCFGMFIRGEGKPEYFMFVNIIVLLFNIGLDYMFVVLFSMKILGVALASLISLLIGLFFTLLFFIRKSNVYKLSKFKFSKDIFKKTVFNGSSELIGELSMSISMTMFNVTILKYAGVDGIAAFTIVGYLSYIFNMVVIGFGQGTSPLISYSYGANEVDLSKKIRKKTNQCVFLFGIMTIGLIIFLSDWYSRVFVTNENIEIMVKTGLYIFSISFLFSGINVITSFYFTSIGKAKESAIISSARGLLILTVCILILPSLFKMNGIWMVAPITEFLTLLISLNFIKKEI